MRIRTIKPEFWRSDDIDELSIEDRLLFIGLWSYVDDSGVGVDKESSIAADLFAGDLARDFSETSLRVHGGLKHLEMAGLITRYESGGKRYLHITNWTKHQKINRPTESRLPRPTSANADDQVLFSEDSLSAHEDALPGTGEQGNRGTTTSSTEVDKFDEFWSAYPKREQKQDARKAWSQQLRKGIKPERMIAGAKGYAEHCKTKGTDRDFLKLPAGWLRAHAFDDHLPPPEPVPDTRPAAEIAKELWRNADAPAVSRILRIPFVEKGQPPSDTTPHKEWVTKTRREWIAEHSDDVIKALEELKASA